VLIKPAPVSLSVKPAAPAVAVLGEMLARAGAGFGGGGSALIEKGRPVEVPPPGAGFTTVTVAIFTVVKSLAGICAVSVVVLINVVVLADPFHWTVAELAKLDPVTVSVNEELPTTVKVEESAVKAGSGFPTVNV